VPRRRIQAGFTLIELLVVLTVLSLGLALLAMRGPPRSAALEVRAAAGEMVQALRLARGRAIASNAAVGLTLDLARHSWRIDGAPERLLPPGYAIVIRAAATETVGDHLAAIRFAPDGSSTGGWIDLSDGHRRMQIGVDWLSGRVTLAEITGQADAR
jgi:general secretion pathway protein H